MSFSFKCMELCITTMWYIGSLGSNAYFGAKFGTLLQKPSHSVQYPLEGYKKQETE